MQATTVNINKHNRGRTEQQARQILSDIKKLLIRHEIWHTVWEYNEPDLKTIEFKACIKVGK